ncbi:hypothetical protein [Peribacillus loiseleuriae]|uniref:hypothetical protein n=1 Tax=Peribacillus loiseleuriae TaxID=1679170 RepID=UPI003D08CADF
MTQYPVIYYYEARAMKEDYTIHVVFPDLKAAGLSASTAGNDREDAREAAQDLLAIAIDMAVDEGKTMPEATPIEKVDIAQFYVEEEVGKPFRIEVEYISV